MKALVIIVSALFAVTASAGEYSKATVWFQSAATFVQAKKVCRDGDTLKHVSKDTVDFTVLEESDSGSTIGKKFYSKVLSQPVISTAQRCAKYESDSRGGDCMAWETYTMNQSSVAVWGYKNSQDMKDGRNGTVIGRYTIPACN